MKPAQEKLGWAFLILGQRSLETKRVEKLMAKNYASDQNLAERYNVSRQTVWRWHRENPEFPRAISLSPGCTRWKLSEIEAWESRISEAV